MKFVVIVLLVLIVASLGSALYFLFADKSGSKRTVTALTLRIGLSILLFALLMAGYYLSQPAADPKPPASAHSQ